MIVLARNTLDDLPEGVQRPLYDGDYLTPKNRNHVTPKIGHIGVGNFHQAHQSWYLRRLVQPGHAHDWAIIGAGVRPHNNDMRGKFKEQDWLASTTRRFAAAFESGFGKIYQDGVESALQHYLKGV